MFLLMGSRFFVAPLLQRGPDPLSLGLIPPLLLLFSGKFPANPLALSLDRALLIPLLPLLSEEVLTYAGLLSASKETPTLVV